MKNGHSLFLENGVGDILAASTTQFKESEMFVTHLHL